MSLKRFVSYVLDYFKIPEFKKYDKELILYDTSFLRSCYFHTDMLKDDTVYHVFSKFIQEQIYFQDKLNIPKSHAVVCGMHENIQNCIIDLDFPKLKPTFEDPADIQLINLAKALKSYGNKVIIKTCDRRLYLRALAEDIDVLYKYYANNNSSPVVETTNHKDEYTLELIFKNIANSLTVIEKNNHNMFVIDGKLNTMKPTLKMKGIDVIPVTVGDTLLINNKMYKIVTLKNIPGNVKKIGI